MVRKFFLNLARVVFAVSMIAILAPILWTVLDCLWALFDHFYHAEWSRSDVVLLGVVGLAVSIPVGYLTYDG
jgi:hypothetical protein